MSTQIYKIVDNQLRLDEYLEDKPELDAKLVRQIREVYSQDTEFSLINKGITNQNDAEYFEYRNFVNSLKVERDAKIAENATKLSNAIDVEYNDNGEVRIIKIYA